MNNELMMKPSELKQSIIDLVRKKRPAYIEGSPGIGKSDSVRAAANDINHELIDIRANLFDPVDLRGVPFVEGGQTKWAIPDFLPKHKGPGIILIDELPAAPQSVQAAFYQLTLDRQLGDYKLPDGWAIVAAGNLETDRAVVHKMPSALANRFTHIRLTVNLDDWLDWATQNGIDPSIVAFIRYRPELLTNFNPAEKINATPRTWAFASDIIGMTHEHKLLAGTVGEGPATEFAAFLKIYRDLPNPDDVLDDPDAHEVPKDISARYALSAALSVRANEDNFSNLVKFSEKFPAEFMAVTIKDSVKRNPQLINNTEFQQWALKHAKNLL